MEGVRDAEEGDWTEMDYIPEMHVLREEDWLFLCGMMIRD